MAKILIADESEDMPELLKDYQGCKADPMPERRFGIHTVVKQVNMALHKYQLL